MGFSWPYLTKPDPLTRTLRSAIQGLARAAHQKTLERSVLTGWYTRALAGGGKKTKRWSTSRPENDFEANLGFRVREFWRVYLLIRPCLQQCRAYIYIVYIYIVYIYIVYIVYIYSIYIYSIYIYRVYIYRVNIGYIYRVYIIEWIYSMYSIYIVYI